MKKIIAIAALAAIVASSTASAFWGWDDSNGYSGGNYDGRGDFVGNGDAEGEATFSMTFTGRGRTNADVRGNGDTYGNWSGYGYENYPYWYGAPYGVGPWGNPYLPYQPQQFQAPVAPPTQ